MQNCAQCAIGEFCLSYFFLPKKLLCYKIRENSIYQIVQHGHAYTVFENVCTFTMLQYGAKEKLSNSTAHIDASFILSIAPVWL